MSTGTITVDIRIDVRGAVRAIQRVRHRLEHAALRGSRWRSPEAFERLRRRHAAERMHMLEQHGHTVAVVTGHDGVSRVRVVG